VSCASLLSTGDVNTLGGRHSGAQEGHHPLHRRPLRRQPAAENVIASSGAKQSIMVLLHAILDPKEEVISRALLGQLSGDGETRRRVPVR